MSRTAVILTFLGAVVALCAQTPVDTPVYLLDYRVSVEAPRSSGAVLSVMWNGRMRAEFSVPSQADADGDFRAQSRYRILEADSLLTEGAIDVSYGSMSASAYTVTLRADYDGGLIAFGGADMSGRINVPFDCFRPVGVDYDAHGMKLISNELVLGQLPAPEFSVCAGPEQLQNILRDSADAREGFYELMDRSNDPEKAIPGGRYLLAMVADGHGGYEIVYMGGARRYEKFWPQMRLKGHLTPTDYADNYDLRWTAASGQPVAEECYATFDPRLRLWTLEFPLLSARLRFRPSR